MSTYSWSKYAEALTAVGGASGASAAANRGGMPAGGTLVVAKFPPITD